MEGAQIFGTRMGLGFLDIKHEDNNQASKYDKYVEDLQGIEEEIRKISHDLKSSMLMETSSIIILLENLVDEKSELGNFEYDIDKKDTFSWNELEDSIKLNIYRITQEVLQNIIKHASATFVKVEIFSHGDFLCLKIIDNGVGFKTSKFSKGIGLKNMVSRIESMSGKIEIKSSKGKGTTVSLYIPKSSNFSAPSLELFLYSH